MLKDRPGEDVITLEDLPAGKKVSVAVAAVDAAGNVSEWIERTGTVSDKVSVPALPGMPWKPKAGGPPKDGNITVWAFPEGVEVDPIATLPVFEPKKEEYKRANPVWSGEGDVVDSDRGHDGRAVARGKVRLAAGRGEIVGFQLGIENAGEPASVDVSVDLHGLAPASRPVDLSGLIHTYRVWYVKAEAGKKAAASQPHWCGEYAVPGARSRAAASEPFPMTSSSITVEVPGKDNAVPGQRLQAVWVDIVVPQDMAPGTYKGSVYVKTGPGPFPLDLALELVVYPVTIPKDLNFQPEMDCYVTPGAEAGSRALHAFYEYHRLAHYNRATINEVIHTQTGTIWEDMAPKLGGEGADTHVADWSEYDRRVGPLLDGSAFGGLPREGVPVRAFYVPFHENWPMRLQGHYQFGAPPQNEWSSQPRMSFDRPPAEDLSWKEIHDLTVKPIDQAFDEAYKKGFERVVGDFVRHFDEKGWTYPYIPMYQNNKFEHHGQWWTLDEPNEWLDWRALEFFADLYHRGMDFPHRARFLYHVDISRPNWQGTFMDGSMDVMYSGGVGLQWPRLMRHIRERTGIRAVDLWFVQRDRAEQPGVRLPGACRPMGRGRMGCCRGTAWARRRTWWRPTSRACSCRAIGSGWRWWGRCA